MSTADVVSIAAKRQEVVSKIALVLPHAGLLLLKAQSLYSPWSVAVMADSTSTSATEAVAGSGATCAIRWYFTPPIQTAALSFSNWIRESEEEAFGGALGGTRMRSAFPAVC